MKTIKELEAMHLTEVGFAHLQALKDVLGLIDEVWTEGYFNYIYVTYGEGIEEVDQQLVEDIDRKVKELKARIEGTSDKVENEK